MASDMIFGGEEKLYYSRTAQQMVEELERSKVVAGKVDAYQLGFAVGVMAGQTKEIENRINFGNLYSLSDADLFKHLMFQMYPAMEPRARKELMDKHAEAGIQMIYEHVTANHGAMDWQRFIETQAPLSTTK